MGKRGGIEVEGAVGEAEVAASAARLEEAAVHMVEAVGPGALVEVVYVLSAEMEAVAEARFDGGEGVVAWVGLGGGGVAAAAGVEISDEGWVGAPGFGGGDLLDGEAVPEAAGAAEGGEAAFCGDTGAGEDEEAVFGVEMKWGDLHK